MTPFDVARTLHPAAVAPMAIVRACATYPPHLASVADGPQAGAYPPPVTVLG